jgi:integrase
MAEKYQEGCDQRHSAVLPGLPACLTRHMVERASAEARLGFKAHPHMLRHACGYVLANNGHDTRALQAYLGHKNIQHTVRYTELSPMRFKDFWAHLMSALAGKDGAPTTSNGLGWKPGHCRNGFTVLLLKRACR